MIKVVFYYSTLQDALCITDNTIICNLAGKYYLQFSEYEV